MKIRNVTFLILGLLLISSVNIYSQSLIDSTFTDTTKVDRTLSTSVDYTTNPGFIQLETGERENLALNRFAYIVYEGTAPADTALRRGQRLVDGSKSSPSFISILPTNQGGLPGTYIIIDLQAVRTVKRVEIQTFFNPQLRPRAFTIFAGLDTIAMERVYQEADNQNVLAIAEFNPTTARFVKITIDVLPQNNNTTISEVEVYGEGFLPLGFYYSSVRNVGKKVNFGTLEFEASIPTETSVSFNFRSGLNPTVDSTWGLWGDEITQTGSLFFVDEPRQYIQYRVKLETNSLESPLVDIIKINYDTLNVITNTNATISPQFAQILKENEFTYIIETNFDLNDRGIDTLIINTPSPSQIREVLVNNLPVGYLSNVNADRMVIFFNSTIRTSGNISVRFVTTPFLGVNPYTSQVSSKEVTHNPQKVDSRITNNTEAWSIVTIGVPDRLIINAEATPNPFTPNNDGINDFTRIEFFLGNIAEPRDKIGAQIRKLTVKIYDLTGKLVKNLYDSDSGSFAFIAENSVSWDGKDNNGKTVRPGVYIYQIIVDSDNGGENISKTVVVAY